LIERACFRLLPRPLWRIAFIRRIDMLYSFSFIAMAFAYLCIGSSFSSFALLPLFISERGGSAADIGIIMGTFSLASVLCRPWISEMVDRIGRKKSFTMGCVLTTVLPACYVLFRGNLFSFYIPLLLVRIVHGVGLAICLTAAFTYAVDIIPKERLNEGIGVFGISGLTGMAAGPVIAEVIIHNFGFDCFFLTAAGVAAVGLLIHLPLPESYADVGGHRAKGPSFLNVLGNHRIITVSLLAFLFGFGLAGPCNFVAPFAHEKQLPFISLYFITYSLAAVLTRVLGGRLADRIGEEHIIPCALAVTGGGLLLLILLNGNTTLALSGLMSGLGHGFLYPSLTALAVRRQPAEIRGKITGIFTGSIDAGMLIGSIALGYVAEYAGFRILFLLAGFALLSGVLVFKLRTTGRSSPENPIYMENV